MGRKAAPDFCPEIKTPCPHRSCFPRPIPASLPPTPVSKGPAPCQPIIKPWAWTPNAGLDGLQLLRKPLPQPGPGEVLVANRAIALNPVDWKICEWGHPAWQQGTVPGVDGAGVVVAVGAGVDMPLGSRVAYHQSLARDGSFAEHCLLDASLVCISPARSATPPRPPCPAPP